MSGRAAGFDIRCTRGRGGGKEELENCLVCYAFPFRVPVQYFLFVFSISWAGEVLLTAKMTVACGPWGGEGGAEEGT